MEKLHIVTVATESKYYFPYLIESCKKNNTELTVLGFGEKWKGFNWRLKLMRSYLLKLPLDDIVCFVDGYDVICTRNLMEMIPVFKQLKLKNNCKIIVGYDNVKNPIVKFIVRSYFKNIINAGTYIGVNKDILEMLDSIYKIDSNDISDDQKLLNKYYNMNNCNIYIDIYGELFGTIISGLPLNNIEKYYTVNDNNVNIKNTNIYPFFIHAPNANYISSILNKLNYKSTTIIDENIRKDYLYKFIKIIYYFLVNQLNAINRFISL